MQINNVVLAGFNSGSGLTGLIADSLADRGIIQKQRSLDLYRSSDTISRAELLGIAIKIKGVKLPEKYICKGYYGDVTKNDWICRAVELGADAGLITRTNKYFRPNDNILNIEALSVLHKSSGLSGNTPSPMMIDFISNEVKIPWHKTVLSNIDKSGLFVEVSASIKGYEVEDITRGEVFNFVNTIFNAQDAKKGITIPIISPGEAYYDQKLSLKIHGAIKNIDEGGTIQNPIIKNNVLIYDWASTGGSHVRVYDIQSENTAWIDAGRVSADGKIIYNCYRGNGYSIYSLEKQRRIMRYRNVKPLAPEDDGMILQEFCHYTKDNGGTLVYRDGTKYSLSKELQDPINVLDTYYSLLGPYRDHDVLYSYNMRKGSAVSFDTFRSWYTDDSYFEIDTKSVKDLGDNTYEFIVLERQDSYEGDKFKVIIKNRYKVKSRVNVEDFTINNISSIKI